MKKLLSAFLAVSMSMTLLSGCGSSSTSSAPSSSTTPNSSDTAAASSTTDDTKPVTIKYWTHTEPTWNDEDTKMIAAFEKENPNITVEVQSFPYDDFQQKIQTSMLSNTGGADVYQLWGGWAEDFSKAGALSPVPNDLIKDFTADSYTPALAGFKLQDKYYGIPLEFNAEYGGLLVNKPWFDSNKIAYPTNWNDMISLAKKNSVSDGAVFSMRGFDFIGADTLTYTWLSMILSSGGNYVSPDGTKFDFNNDISKKTLQELVNYVKDDKLTNIDGIAGNSDIENEQWLFMNQALMVPRGAWSVPAGEADYNVKYGTDFDYVPEPFYGSQKLWAAETGWGLSVNAKSANADAAWKFVTFLTRADNLKKIDIACGMVPSRKSVALDPDYVKTMPYTKPIIDVLDGASFVGYINTDTLKEDIDNMYIDIINNGTSVDDAVVQLNAKIASDLSQ